MSKRNKRATPVFNQAIIETHCHLDYLKEYSLEELVERSQEVGIEKIITIAVSPDNLEKVMKLTQQHPMIWGTQGVHPHDAQHFQKETESHIRENAQDPRILAIGEIGLDYFYEHSDRKTQQQVFENQLQIASDMNLPVVIHSREADDDTMSILKNFESSLKQRGVIHSFTSGPELAQYAIDQEYCLGFNGICTFNTAENVRDIIRMTPVEQIILETDAPYLAPMPNRGKRNEPAWVRHTAECLAECHGISTEELAEITTNNALRVFGLS